MQFSHATPPYLLSPFIENWPYCTCVPMPLFPFRIDSTKAVDQVMMTDKWAVATVWSGRVADGGITLQTKCWLQVSVSNIPSANAPHALLYRLSCSTKLSQIITLNDLWSGSQLSHLLNYANIQIFEYEVYFNTVLEHITAGLPLDQACLKHTISPKIRQLLQVNDSRYYWYLI